MVSPSETWVEQLATIARSRDFAFPAAEIGSSLEESITRWGPEKITRAWIWWLDNAATLGEEPANLTPKYFGRTLGYWITMSEPAVRV